MLVKLFMFSLVTVVMVVGVGEGARILGMLPLWAKSHHLFLQAVMRALAEAGHEVVLYSPIPLILPAPNLTFVHLDSITNEGPELDRLFLAAMNLPNWKGMDVTYQFEEYNFREFMKEPKIHKLLSSEEKFDLIFTEAFTAQDFTLALMQRFNAPMIALHTWFTNFVANSYSGNSLSIAYIPDTCFPFSDRMTFQERAWNAFAVLRGLYVHHTWYWPKKERQMKKYFPDTPPISEMAMNVSMTFVNDHLTAGYAHPRTPNIVPVGGIHILPEKPLPTNIQKFMDEAPEGVIFFSLGTYVPDELQPQEYFDTYINVFKRLPQRVVWKTRKERIERLPSNVMVLKWAPQPDILAHRKCVLFITHAGLFSTHETIHFGVPVVGIPQFADQRRNARFYEAKEIGVMLDPAAVTELSVLAAIRTVLGNPKYKENVKRLSQIFRDQPMTPQQSVVYWTEYVLRHRGARHLRPASTSLSWYQRALLDVLALVLLVAAGIAGVVLLLARKVLRHSRGRVSPVKKYD